METEAARRRSALVRVPRISAILGILVGRAPTAAPWRTVAIPRPPVGVFWATLALLIALYAAHQGVGLGGRGSDHFFNKWGNAGLLWLAAIACLVGALRQVRGRVAWLLVTAALTSWALGDTIWSIRFGDSAAVPATSVSDVFWLAWYPLIVAALVMLVRDRVPGFELHRWIDGVAVMLIVATPWVAVFLEPVLEASHESTLARALNFVYPLGDAVLFGATLGVFALMAWRPSRMWVVFGTALLMMGLADAIYSVSSTGHSHDQGIYDVAWVAGAALVAFAAWEPHPGQLEPRRATGWRAIALPLAAQLMAVSIQIYAFFHEIARSERILTALVLVIAMVQVVATRPRAQSGGTNHRDHH